MPKTGKMSYWQQIGQLQSTLHNGFLDLDFCLDTTVSQYRKQKYKSYHVPLQKRKI